MVNKNTWQMVSNRIDQLSALYNRMDTTRQLLELADFKLRDFRDKFDLDNVINVTGNRMASYGHRVIESLSAYKWQTIIEGDISKTDSARMEAVLNSLMAWTNKYISENFEEIPDLYSFWVRHICNRGRIGAMWMPYVEEGQFRVHCTPLDMRWTPYVRNRWFCPIFFRNGDDLEQECEQYEKEAKQKGISFNKPGFKSSRTTEDNEVRDFWSTERREFWVNNQLVFADTNPFDGKLPFVVVVSPSGNMFRDRGYKEYEGEDIYFLIRKLEKEFNRSLSVESTIAFEQLFPSYEYEQNQFDSAPSEPAPNVGETKKVPAGELHRLVPKPDINTAGMTTRQDISRMLDDGAPMTPRAYAQPPSGAELAIENEMLGQLLNSRITALQTGLAQLYRWMVDSTRMVAERHKGAIEIPGLGNRRSFVVGQLKDTNRYTISCRLMNKSVRMEMANLSIAAAAKGTVPDVIIIRDIMKADDPAEWERQLEMQKAKVMNPALGLAEMAVSYAEEADETDDETEKEFKKWQWRMLVDEFVRVMEARMQPQQPVDRLPQRQEPEKPNFQGMLAIPALLGGTTGRAPRQEQEVRQP